MRIFGNVSEADIERTAGAAPELCAAGAMVIWTRHRRPPDITPRIRAWFTGAGIDEVAFDAWTPAPWRRSEPAGSALLPAPDCRPDRCSPSAGPAPEPARCQHA
jgi:hypothetical protein